jgi:hypothetical protein
VLAHEYGHFSHRDTAGGDMALRVRQDMAKLAQAMVQHGQAVPWNLAFQFLRVYDFLFRRISHGATRLQEILADRVAAHHYGAADFEEGLTHVIRRHVEFELTANREIQLAVKTRRALQNMYGLETLARDNVERSVAEALARPTTEDDTHPSPLDRFRLVRDIVGKTDTAGSGMVWDLFTDRERLTAEMTAVIEARVRDFVTSAA